MSRWRCVHCGYGVRIYGTCPGCDRPAPSPQPECEQCDGTGRRQYSASGYSLGGDVECPVCNGTGSSAAVRLCGPDGVAHYVNAEEYARFNAKPAPSPQPEMPEGFEEFWSMGVWRYVRLDGHGLSVDDMRALLATQGLAIVPAAEVTTPGERKVLEACEGLDEGALRWLHKGTSLDIVTLVEAVLARRAEKETNG